MNNQKGIALIMALFILTSILVISFGAAELVIPGIKMGRVQTYSTKAYFTAESGAERILWGIRKNSFSISTCNSESSKYVNFLEGGCVSGKQSYFLPDDEKYEVICASKGALNIFKSIGTYLGIKRSVQISY